VLSLLLEGFNLSIFGLHFGDQSADAVNYLQLGSACAKRATGCWDKLRPVGANLYFSLPFRLGLPPESIIILNLALVAGSIALADYVSQKLGPLRGWQRWCRLLAIVVPHLVFLWAPSWNSLSDVPATVFALASVQLMLLTRAKDHFLCYLAIGISLGICLSLRAFFLYPALLAVASLLLVSASDLPRLLRRLVTLVIFIPITLQFWATYTHTSKLAFIDPKTEAWGRKVHFESTLAGYDTFLQQPVKSWDAKECFRNSRNFRDALDKRDLSAASCLLLRRQEFYFGTYTHGGKVYLSSPADRHQSRIYLILSSIVLVVALGRLIVRRRIFEGFPAVSFLVAVWGQSLLIIPEARFISLVLVWMWCEVLTAMVPLVGKVARHSWNRLRPHQTSGSKSDKA
jgi:hypothetical protein